MTRAALNIARRTGLAESSIWRLAQQILFPMPIKLSPGCTAWLEREIDKFFDAKVARRETIAVCGENAELGGAR